MGAKSKHSLIFLYPPYSFLGTPLLHASSMKASTYSVRSILENFRSRSIWSFGLGNTQSVSHKLSSNIYNKQWLLNFTGASRVVGFFLSIVSATQNCFSAALCIFFAAETKYLTKRTQKTFIMGQGFGGSVHHSWEGLRWSSWSMSGWEAEST